MMWALRMTNGWLASMWATCGRSCTVHCISSHLIHALDMLGMLILKLVYISYCKFVVV